MPRITDSLTSIVFIVCQLLVRLLEVVELFLFPFKLPLFCRSCFIVLFSSVLCGGMPEDFTLFLFELMDTFQFSDL